MRVLWLLGFAVVVLVGLVVAGLAAGVLLVAMDVIPLTDEMFEVLAPRWLVGLAALVLVLTGFAIATAVLPLRRTRLTLTGAAILGFLTTLTLLPAWITASAGDRVYVRVAGARVPLPTNLTETRILVGFFALVFSLMTLAAWLNLLRQAWRALTGAEHTGRA